MDSKLITRLIELIEQDIMETEHLLALAREDFDRLDANDVIGQANVRTLIAQQMRKLAQLQAEHRDWTLKT